MIDIGTKILDTDRLSLRKFDKEDVSDIFNNWASDIEVVKYLSWDVHKNIEVTKKYVDYLLEGYKQSNNYHWAIVFKETNEVIGDISAVSIDEKNNSCEIGYCISRKFWNMGIMTEALNRVIEFFISEVKVKRVYAKHDVRNIGSGKVMKKAGMNYLETIRKVDSTKGEYDADVYFFEVNK